MISDAQKVGIASLATNRSRDSWFAGSIVIARLIERTPNDLDIHHLTSAAMRKALDDDLQSLANNGFVIEHRSDFATEVEVVFRREYQRLEINWVLEHSLPQKLVDDPWLGCRASLADVVSRKIAMLGHDRLPKHKKDLEHILMTYQLFSRELSADDERAIKASLRTHGAEDRIT